MASDPSTTSVYLDPAEAAAARQVRRKRFYAEEVPRLRLIGFMLNAVAVVLHNWLIFDQFSVASALQTTGVLVGYALVAWGVSALAWDRAQPRGIELGDLFLGLDLVPLMYVVYVTGANQSLMWFVFVARAADQVAISFRNALIFSHLSTAAYATVILWVSFGEHRLIDWPTELAKIAFLYILCLYITLSARTVAGRRKKFDVARRMAEQAVRDAEDRRRDLEHALERLEAANRTKGEFLANVSHEIRTPLNSVIGNAELLLDTPLSRDQRDLIGVMRDSAESLTRIVNDILDLSRMDAQRLPLESIPLRVRELVGATIRMFAARAHQKGLELVCHVDRDVPDGLLGDPHRLRQILTNIVNNAIKFTETGEVVLKVSAEDQHEGRTALRFSVRDTGIGIAKARQPAIFEAFTQADGSDTRRFGGTGLGLTIAAQLVSLMQGRLWVESEEGHGSTFSFIAWFDTPSGSAQAPSPWGDASLRVMVVDAHVASRDAAIEVLAPWASRVAGAANGHQALAAIEHASQTGQSFDVVFVDASLPGLDGFALAEQVRSAPAAAKHVVILLSTTQLATGSDRAEALGAAYITKPLTSPIVSEVLTSLASGQPVVGTAPGPRRTRHPLRVLVVDDHMVNQAVAAATLRKWGHAVASAADGQEALDKTASESFDVVLMDLQMPVMDGLQATRHIRAREAAQGLARLPIIAMTARAMTEDKDRCLAAGMDEFLSKPMDPQKFFDTLEQIGSSQRAHTDARPSPTRSSTPGLTALTDDPEIAHQLATVFVATVPEQLLRLRSAVAAQDPAQIASMAHAIRGAVSYFSGGALVAPEDLARLQQLEDDARHGQMAESASRLAAIEEHLATLLEQLQHYLSTTPGGDAHEAL